MKIKKIRLFKLSTIIAFMIVFLNIITVKVDAHSAKSLAEMSYDTAKNLSLSDISFVETENGDYKDGVVEYGYPNSICIHNDQMSGTTNGKLKGIAIVDLYKDGTGKITTSSRNGVNEL